MDAIYCEPGRIDEFLNVAALVLLDDLKIALILMWSFEIPENEAGRWFPHTIHYNPPAYLNTLYIFIHLGFGVITPTLHHCIFDWPKCFTHCIQNMVLKMLEGYFPLKGLIFRV